MSVSKSDREAVLRKCDREAIRSSGDREAVTNRQQSVRVALRPLQTFLRQVRDELGLREASVTICLVSDAEIARMNETFRKKKGPTDVLSFPATTRRRPGSMPAASNKIKKSEFLGDIAISPATARRYARKNGRRLPNELRVLILHGVLHLLGYDHETDRGEMGRVERKLRKRFGLT
jgi:probable rRNA maturation factor